MTRRFVVVRPTKIAEGIGSMLDVLASHRSGPRLCGKTPAPTELVTRPFVVSEPDRTFAPLRGAGVRVPAERSPFRRRRTARDYPEDGKAKDNRLRLPGPQPRP